MNKALLAIPILLIASPAGAGCLGTNCPRSSTSVPAWQPQPQPQVVQPEVHVHAAPDAPGVYLPPPPPTVVLPCRKTPRTAAEKLGAAFSALGGVIEKECDPADVRREQEEQAAKVRLMEEQRRLIEAQRKAIERGRQ